MPIGAEPKGTERRKTRSRECVIPKRSRQRCRANFHKLTTTGKF
jgi:hypothetical protein